MEVEFIDVKLVVQNPIGLQVSNQPQPCLRASNQLYLVVCHGPDPILILEVLLTLYPVVLALLANCFRVIHWDFLGFAVFSDLRLNSLHQQISD